jgi:uncharacterized protein (TIGR02001 family)
MKKIITSIALAVGSVSVAHAELSGNIGIVSDYAFRGVSQTDEGAALQGTIVYEHASKLYVGASGTNIDKSVNGANVELDIFAGYHDALGKVSYDIGVMRYQYPGSNVNQNTNEVYGAVGYGPATIRVSYALGDYFGAANSDGTVYAMGALSHTYSNGVTASASLGRTFGQGAAASYNDWAVGVSKNFGGFDIGLTYVDTNINNDLSDSRVVASVGKHF